ncbi:hypothetical protein [Hymenobacter cellulosilyticus]|uniref:hypothetical protein n=1 Tax=Hymenobacter cellulosilyticus TaxID=2932248 RepID=UPI0028807D6E|nr:hypothetical protein [Hymenobacter cellulosilyticus]
MGNSLTASPPSGAQAQLYGLQLLDFALGNFEAQHRPDFVEAMHARRARVQVEQAQLGVGHDFENVGVPGNKKSGALLGYQRAGGGE